MGVTLVAPDLAGSNEFPGPGDPDGSGSATVYLDANAGIVCWAFQFSGLATPLTGSHIHQGDAGTSGPIVVNFGADSGCTSGVSTSLIDDIVADPVGFYVNLHNADFPTGAIRQQLETATLDPQDMTATMDATQEVPPVDSPGTGEAEVSVDPNGLVCFELTTEDLTSPVILAHIHDGAAGVAGPIVVDLQFPLWGDGPACVVTTEAVAAAIIADPGEFYFNVHTEQFGNGEIRGQLEAVPDETTTTTSTTTPVEPLRPTAPAPTAPVAPTATAVSSAPSQTG
jgi:hypothetical protein